MKTKSHLKLLLFIVLLQFSVIRINAQTLHTDSAVVNDMVEAIERWALTPVGRDMSVARPLLVVRRDDGFKKRSLIESISSIGFSAESTFILRYLGNHFSPLQFDQNNKWMAPTMTESNLARMYSFVKSLTIQNNARGIIIIDEMNRLDSSQLAYEHLINFLLDLTYTGVKFNTGEILKPGQILLIGNLVIKPGESLSSYIPRLLRPALDRFRTLDKSPACSAFR